ncbi:hypothetical protein ACFL1H_00935 [Nanoarchaeota archaeon]
MSRVNFELDDKKLVELKRLVKELGAVSVADVIRSSIDLHNFLEKEKLSGKKIIIRDDKRNKEREIVLL